MHILRQSMRSGRRVAGSKDRRLRSRIRVAGRIVTRESRVFAINMSCQALILYSTLYCSKGLFTHPPNDEMMELSIGCSCTCGLAGAHARPVGGKLVMRGTPHYFTWRKDWPRSTRGEHDDCAVTSRCSGNVHGCPKTAAYLTGQTSAFE